MSIEQTDQDRGEVVAKRMKDRALAAKARVSSGRGDGGEVGGEHT